MSDRYPTSDWGSETSFDPFAEIVERIEDPIMIQDLDGNFRIVNDAVAKYADMPAEDLIGTDEFAFMDEESATRIQEMKDRVLDSEDAVTYEISPTFPQKGECMFSTRRYPYYDDDGNLAGTIAICRDVTKLREQRRDLRRENDRLEEFARVISHDLRNPLNVAQGRIRLLEKECDSEDIDPLADALDRMDTIIEDTLTLAREGNTVADTESLSITDFTRRCWEMVDTTNATLTVEEEFTIEGDPDRLRHVFENLFRNAVEHGGEGVTVRVGRGGPRSIYVEDDGPGIQPDEGDAVFDPGYSTSGGTGFGLTIVNRMVEAHGWGIRVTEGADGGARFEFTGVSIDG
jgi:PAS domain S-box-containing protein